MGIIRRILFVLVLLLTLVIIAMLTSSGSPMRSTTIVDVSWPNCRYDPHGGFLSGIIGVTGGLDFRPNPCLAVEASWFVRYAAYMNTGYPGGAIGGMFRSSPYICSSVQQLCLAYNYGFHAATYALDYAASQNVHTEMWWLDVETENSWTPDTAANTASLMGAMAAIRQETFAPVGFYSTPRQWQRITGGWQNGLPAWIGTGTLSRSAAAPYCRAPSFTGGPVLLSQYTIIVDENVTCPSVLGRSVEMLDPPVIP